MRAFVVLALFFSYSAKRITLVRVDETVTYYIKQMTKCVVKMVEVCVE